jgi:hypothetical protein
VSGEGTPRIVSGGRQTIRGTPEYEAAVREVRERVRASFAPLVAQASFVRRLPIRIQRWRRTRREIEALAPHDALYASRSASGRRDA